VLEAIEKGTHRSVILVRAAGGRRRRVVLVPSRHAVAPRRHHRSARRHRDGDPRPGRDRRLRPGSRPSDADADGRRTTRLRLGLAFAQQRAVSRVVVAGDPFGRRPVPARGYEPIRRPECVRRPERVSGRPELLGGGPGPIRRLGCAVRLGVAVTP